MDKRIDILIQSWQKRNIAGWHCPDKRAASIKILETIPEGSSIGISGSVTLDEIGIVKKLEERGNRVWNQYKPGLTREQSLEIRRHGAAADYYLASANAISEQGEMVFFSAQGQRIAGIANAKKVLVVAGVNKITPVLDSALKRAREYATPLNCQRLKFNTPCLAERICRKEICLFPEYRRMCCQILIIEAEVAPDRLSVILVNEKLGF